MINIFKYRSVPIDSLVGKTFTSVIKGDAEIIFKNDTDEYILGHYQDCCEQVDIEDINGDLNDLVGVPILAATEASNKTDPPKNKWDESYTWTFYNFRTIKGYVSLRWYGESNGYYSEKVDLFRKTHESV